MKTGLLLGALSGLLLFWLSWYSTDVQDVEATQTETTSSSLANLSEQKMWYEMAVEADAIFVTRTSENDNQVKFIDPLDDFVNDSTVVKHVGRFIDPLSDETTDFDDPVISVGEFENPLAFVEGPSLKGSNHATGNYIDPMDNTSSNGKEPQIDEKLLIGEYTDPDG